MSWKFAVFSIAVMAMSCAGEDKLKIKWINLDDTGDKIHVCFTAKKADVPDDSKSFNLYIGTSENGEQSDGEDYDMDGTYTAPASDDEEVCVHFDQSSNHFTISPKKLFFILSRTDDLLINGKEYITLIELSPTVSAQWIGVKTRKHGNSLRITEDITGWSICGDHDPMEDPRELECKASTGPCYAVNIDVNSPEPLSVCKKNDNDVQVLVKSIDSPTDATGSAPPITDITLDYKTKTITVVGATDATDETVVYYEKDSDEKVHICASSSTCTNAAYEPGDNELKIIFVTKDPGTNVASGSTELKFQDSDLKLTKLDETVMESKWTKHEEEYIAKHNGLPADSPFSEVDAHCKNNHDFCYAYFVEIATAKKYTVTTKPVISGSPSNKNAITSIGLQMTPPGIMNKFLKNVNIEKHFEKDSGIFELSTCFSSDSTNGLNNTQLEAILVSANKQWRQVLEESVLQVEQRSCYSTTFMLKSESDSDSMTTALVIQRDVKSGEVLSFYRSDINLSEVKAIKPDEDNSSNGSTSTLAIVGAAIGGVACLMALVAAAIIFVIKRKRNNDGLQYPLHHTNVEGVNVIHGLDNPNST